MAHETVRPAATAPSAASSSATSTASEEMFAPVETGVELCYQTFGDPDDDPLVLVMGLGGPMTWWDAELCEQLAAAGFYVVRFDNRDAGRSTRFAARVRHPAVARAFLTGHAAAPYRMSDLADDVRGLLDHLGLPAAHVAGVSMGGMIAQTLAVSAPDRVLSLTSISSTTGRRRVGGQNPRLLPLLIAPRRDTRDEYVETSKRVWKAISSPDYPSPESELVRRAGETWDRGISGTGVLRQMLAILTQPDRTKALKQLEIPVGVLHGMKDHMVHVSGGRATARAVHGAEVVLVPGMGHDLPEQLYPTIVGLIRRTADRARAS